MRDKLYSQFVKGVALDLAIGISIAVFLAWVVVLGADAAGYELKHGRAVVEAVAGGK